MQRVTTIADARSACSQLAGTIAFVPTMGFLHDGHLALMREGLRRADHLVVSVFVNPTQFGPGEDLEDYPRDLKGDAKKCRNLGCDVFFAPRDEPVYADQHSTRVIVDDLDRSLCGQSRPDHFCGVTTIVTKLFNIISPDIAVFGQKDLQQLVIIERMVRDLNFPIEIIGVPIVREKDGLAMSSRNRYLDEAQRRQATSLSRSLVAAHRAHSEDPALPCGRLVDVVRTRLSELDEARIDYVECVHPQTLVPYEEDAPIGPDGAVMAMAVYFGSARLIDNLRIDRPLPDGPLRSLK